MTDDTTCDTVTKEPKTLSLDAFSRAQMRLEAGLRPDWLGELERSRRPPSRNRGRGPSSKGKGKGKGRDEEVEGKRKEVRKGRRELSPFYLTSGYGPGMRCGRTIYYILTVSGSSDLL